jgi:hypothetical protein
MVHRTSFVCLERTARALRTHQAAETLLRRARSNETWTSETTPQQLEMQRLRAPGLRAQRLGKG